MTNHSISLPSPAKLNLFLHITGRRNDGYHELQTIFQFINVCDQLDFTTTNDALVHILPAIKGVPLEENLIYKAAQALKPFAKNEAFGANISLKKRLPMGGGIGGGSSNAATTLLALNQLWQCDLSTDALANIGRHLGADVPVFVRGNAAFAEGIGELLTSVEPETPFYLLVKPDCHVATGQIFADKYLTRDTPPIRIAHALKLSGQNDCLEVVKKHNPEVNEAFEWLQDYGDVKLTGTGACLFIAYNTIEDAERVRASVPKKWQTWVCQGCNVSPTHLALNQWIKKQKSLRLNSELSKPDE
ncbi:4-(cytidine 5'-diphospho)-2-C-methyl-D-erythritol kinase [Marinomonas mediterranea]|uniref:4-(cytidine 5'-diphospho)-2-C-methyl-D-erythritol kinase n=1 Tax=Marinomonas mediterranea TaxID=119864 RepID=UPI00234B622B|nr:4-(cytidine 5'-diphospho)-2-C-methyl-D-erythritol kinase [Marinomonas mediterranea]WCN10149.1 4-(cytidine 5'-diphospho)-2-C-methyl-D-erythritol kinase [Marinomonas mediterranea]WCN14194.1 4-(cytidine 5'-diphospho)-2-C-methyl-D-erythritol kinase [Marinomonas mediterranea]